MENSILNLVKRSIGLAPEYDVFDENIIMHINSVFMILAQIGVGPKKGFRIDGKDNQWDEFLSSDDDNMESVKSYMCAKVRLLFDPPSNSAHIESLKTLITEFEWRLNFESEQSK